jgi:hypothetical protein
MAAGDMATFQADLAKFARDNRVALRTIVRKLALDIHRGLVLRTPRDTGRAASNWIPTLEAPAQGTQEPDNAARTKAMVASIAATLPDFPSVWISNNLPYIQRLNEGHSKQAPAGFVQIVVDGNVARLRTQP